MVGDSLMDIATFPTLDGYYQDIQDLLSPDVFLVPDGATFIDRISDTSGIGTNTTKSTSIDPYGAAGVEFNGTTSTADITSLNSTWGLTGETHLFLVKLNDWESGVFERILQRFASGANRLSVAKRATDDFDLFYEYDNTTIVQTTYDMPVDYEGYHQLIYTFDSTNADVYLDGVRVDRQASGGIPNTDVITLNALGDGTLNGAISLYAYKDAFITQAKVNSLGIKK